MKMALRCVELEPQVADYQYQFCLTYTDEGDGVSALKQTKGKREPTADEESYGTTS